MNPDFPCFISVIRKSRVTVKLVFLFALVFPFSRMQAQNQNVSNYIFGDTEPYIVANPANPDNLVAAWIKVTGILLGSIACSYSTDGGQTWSTPINMPHQYANFTAADPSIDFNSSGTAWMSYVDYHPSMDSGYVVVTKSTDGGATWSTPVRAVSGLETPDLPADRPWIAIDRSGGTYDGRIYVCTKSVDIGQLPHHVWLKHSSDGGMTWSPLILIDDSVATGFITTSMGCMDVAADGSLNIAYLSLDLSVSLQPRIIMVKSTDGGNTFTPYVVGIVASNSAINDSLYQGSACLRANPANAGNLIFIATDARNGDADILALSSFDGGVTWTSVPVRINDDAAANGVGQDMCWGGFSPNGTFAAVWRDRRNSGTSSSDDYEIFTSVSTDGGLNFKPNYRISDAPSPVITILKGNDFLGVALTNTYLHTNWGDKRVTNNHEIFYNRDSLSVLVGMRDDLQKQFNSLTCFPNPAGNMLSIEIDAKKTGKADLVIVDLSGRIVYTQNAVTFTSGKNRQSIDCSNFSAGEYMIRLNGPGWSETLKFVKSPRKN